MIYGLSDEKYTTYKNSMMKTALNSMQDVRWNSIRDFIPPEAFLQQFAQALSMMQLNVILFPGLEVELYTGPEDPGGRIVGAQLLRIGKLDVVNAEQICRRQ